MKPEERLAWIQEGLRGARDIEPVSHRLAREKTALVSFPDGSRILVTIEHRLVSLRPAGDPVGNKHGALATFGWNAFALENGSVIHGGSRIENSGIISPEGWPDTIERVAGLFRPSTVDERTASAWRNLLSTIWRETGMQTHLRLRAGRVPAEFFMLADHDHMFMLPPWVAESAPEGISLQKSSPGVVAWPRGMTGTAPDRDWERSLTAHERISSIEALHEAFSLVAPQGQDVDEAAECVMALRDYVAGLH